MSTSDLITNQHLTAIVSGLLTIGVGILIAHRIRKRKTKNLRYYS